MGRAEFRTKKEAVGNKNAFHPVPTIGNLRHASAFDLRSGPCTARGWTDQFPSNHGNVLSL
jgi:hypothetical protein